MASGSLWKHGESFSTERRPVSRITRFVSDLKSVWKTSWRTMFLFYKYGTNATRTLTRFTFVYIINTLEVLLGYWSDNTCFHCYESNYSNSKGQMSISSTLFFVNSLNRFQRVDHLTSQSLDEITLLLEDLKSNEDGNLVIFV